MPAPRKATSILMNSGSIDHDKKRYANRTSEPKPKGALGSAPKHFTPELLVIWKELVRQIPPGVLKNSDRIILELTCRLTYQMRYGVEFTSSNAAQLVSCLSRLAMTPSDRSRVNLAPEHGDPAVAASPFKKFAA